MKIIIDTDTDLTPNEKKLVWLLLKMTQKEYEALDLTASIHCRRLDSCPEGIVVDGIPIEGDTVIGSWNNLTSLDHYEHHDETLAEVIGAQTIEKWHSEG